MPAGQEIVRALLLISNAQFEEALEICEAVHENALNGCNPSQIKEVKNKLFEAGLEISLAGHNDIAKRVLNIANSPSSPNIPSTLGGTYHPEANVCWLSLTHGRRLYSGSLVRVLEKAITENEDLKCVPYFLGRYLSKVCMVCSKILKRPNNICK